MIEMYCEVIGETDKINRDEFLKDMVKIRDKYSVKINMSWD